MRFARRTGRNAITSFRQLGSECNGKPHAFPCHRWASRVAALSGATILGPAMQTASRSRPDRKSAIVYRADRPPDGGNSTLDLALEASEAGPGSSTENVPRTCHGLPSQSPGLLSDNGSHPYIAGDRGSMNRQISRRQRGNGNRFALPVAASASCPVSHHTTHRPSGQDRAVAPDHEEPRVASEHYFLPGDLERQIGAFVEVLQHPPVPREPRQPDARRRLLRQWASRS